MRVLLQNRPNALIQRGGDTVLMEKLAQGLKLLGVEAVIDLSGRPDYSGVDLVHLFNFATPDYTRQLAEEAYRHNVPFVVTTLYEDIPAFHNQSIEVAQRLVEYVQRGQARDWYAAKRVNVKEVMPCAGFDNSWTALHAAALFSTGTYETACLRRDYPGTAGIAEIRFGYEVSSAADPDLFVRQYGVRDFVLCVGRIESRKNQLMLLKALEDSELPVVLAGGGFTYQPAYDRAVRAFRRRGRTIVLEKLSAEMLASAYSAARVHCLPSWFELPGLVHLEAAWYGCQVVTSRSGTISDYFGDRIFYCNAWDEDSIREAVLEAYRRPVSPELKRIAADFSWDLTARSTYEVYKQVLEKGTTVKDSTESASYNPGQANTYPQGEQAQAWNAAAAAEPDITSFLAQAEEAARNRDFPRAIELLEEAVRTDPTCGRSYRMRGAVHLAQGDQHVARRWFDTGLKMDPADARSLSGIGMCHMMDGAVSEAYDCFIRALQLDSTHLVTLMQLVECSYRLGRFEDLEGYLRLYVAQNPQDMEMTYCHAGCLYKLGRMEEAEKLAQKVLISNPQHLGARQLWDLMSEHRAGSNPRSGTQVEVIPTVEMSQPSYAAPAMSFSDVDRQLSELEDHKRAKNLEMVRIGSKGLLARGDLSPAQREKAMVLDAEAAVLSNQLEEAQRLYDEILNMSPYSARAMCGQGALAANRGDWQAARWQFENALRIDPDYDVALAGLGLCWHWFQDSEKAWEYYYRATQANPENSRALLGVIEIGYALGRLPEVENSIKAYLDMHPADLDILYSLAGCYFAQGKKEEALYELNKIMLFRPEDEKVRELRDMIENGENASSGA